jgi:hypothetical protein
MAVYQVKNNGLEPNKWPVVKFADIGGDEPFVKQILELATIVDAGLIEGNERENLKEAVVSILVDGLMPAFAELEKIRALAEKNIPLMNRWQMYEDLARRLWKTHKELMQKAAALAGFDLGFLFKDEKEFQKGLKALRQLHPTVRAGVEKFLEGTRDRWQNDLSQFRNTWVEHQTGDREKFKKFYDPQYAESLFHAVWETSVQILAVLLEVHLPHGTRLVEQHPNDPGPRWPNRFRYDHPAFRNMK